MRVWYVFVDASTRDCCAGQVTGSSMAAFTWARPQRTDQTRPLWCDNVLCIVFIFTSHFVSLRSTLMVAVSYICLGTFGLGLREDSHVA